MPEQQVIVVTADTRKQDHDDSSNMIIPSSPIVEEEEEEEEFMQVVAVPAADENESSTTDNKEEQQQKEEEQIAEVAAVLASAAEEADKPPPSIVIATTPTPSVVVDETTPTPNQHHNNNKVAAPSTTTSEQAMETLLTTITSSTTTTQPPHTTIPSSPNSLLDELDHIFDTTTTTTTTTGSNGSGSIHLFPQTCLSSSLTIPIRDCSLNHCSQVLNNNFQRRKRKDHPSPTLYEQQIKQHTKRTKTNINPIHQNIPINFVSNSAFLLSNVIESPVPYNNTTVCYDDHSTHQCPWLDLLSNNVGGNGELVVEESSVLFGKLQKLSLLQNSSSSSVLSSSSAANSSSVITNTNNTNSPSRYNLLTDPYCTIMRIGGRIYREIYSGDDNHHDHDSLSSSGCSSSSCTFNALINCEKDNKFLILQLQNNVLNDRIFAVYARFGQVGRAGHTYSRLFDNLAHAKQFFVDSLLALTTSTISTTEAATPQQCSTSFATGVCYDIPSISFF